VGAARRGAGIAAQRKWPEAIDEFRLTLGMTPGDAEAKAFWRTRLNQQGSHSVDASQFGAAAAVFRQAAALDPRQALIRQNLCGALLDDRDLAAAGTRPARRLRSPERCRGVCVAGQGVGLAGKMPEAVAQFEHALRLAPGDAHIEEDLSRVKAASR
jgi:Flp pilus assembly protein TadD